MRATEIPIKQPMRSEDFEKAVFDRWGDECVVCTRRPEEWNRTQNKLSFHHVNGDDTDDRIENLIPVCQSCHIKIHRTDEPPYRKWHRQLPIEDRNVGNNCYEGPRLTREQAERRFGDEGGVPTSVRYLKKEREDFDPSIFESDEQTNQTDETDSEAASGTELQECPVCGRIGLPERIADHDCQSDSRE